MPETTSNIPEFYAIDNPLAKSTDLASADKVENFFMKVRNSIKTETIDIQNQVSKSACQHYISVLQKTQKS